MSTIEGPLRFAMADDKDSRGGHVGQHNGLSRIEIKDYKVGKNSSSKINKL